MKTYTEIQNAQIGTLIQEFTEQAVAFYDGMKEQPVCRPAKEATLEHLEKQTIPQKDVRYRKYIRKCSGTFIPIRFSGSIHAAFPAFRPRRPCFPGWAMS